MNFGALGTCPLHASWQELSDALGSDDDDHPSGDVTQVAIDGYLVSTHALGLVWDYGGTIVQSHVGKTWALVRSNVLEVVNLAFLEPLGKARGEGLIAVHVCSVGMCLSM